MNLKFIEGHKIRVIDIQKSDNKPMIPTLPTDTDFGTLKRFKLSIKSVDFKKFLHIEC